jgi:glycosyltransferase involved in cell wall biosynthesis
MSTVSAPPLISVIVPIYNVAVYLHQCIHSIYLQSYKNLEIILVDDGSTDESRIICETFARRDNRVIVINKENTGLVSARKSGLVQATGEYVLNVDGDDWLALDCIEKLVANSLNGAADIVLAGFYREFVGKEVVFTPSMPQGLYSKDKIEKLIFPSMIFNLNSACHGVATYSWGKLFKRELLKKYQLKVPDSITIGEDTVVTYPALADADLLSVIHNPVYFYRQRSRSMLKKSASSDVELFAINRMCDFLITQMGSSNFDFKEQIDAYRLMLILIRTGGLYGKNQLPSWLFPMPLDFKNQKIVLYSSGSFGQAIWKSFIMAGHKFAGWVDEDCFESQLWGVDVIPLSELTVLAPNVCIIATFDKNKFNDIAKNMAAYLGEDCIIIQPSLPKGKEISSIIHRIYNER